jgi:hypothetical protein
MLQRWQGKNGRLQKLICQTDPLPMIFFRKTLDNRQSVQEQLHASVKYLDELLS